MKTLAKSTGDNVAVFTDAYLKNVQNIEIGSNVSFQPMSFIDGFGGIKIGNDVSFAEGASVFSMTHIYSDPDVPIKDQGMRPLPVVIEDNVWIGAKATILGGITLASGTIVAAGAVVTKSTERNTTVAGVPASVINVRK